MLREASYYTRMAYGLWQFMRTPPHADSEAVIRHELRNREANFLTMVRDGILAKPANPLGTMLALAGSEFGDVETMVRRDGLESTLTRLYEAGVYLTHDEFKGRAPIVRSGREIPYDLDGCVNPLMVKGGLESSSSGSRSQGLKSRRNIDHVLYREAWNAIAAREFDPDQNTAWVSLTPILPAVYGITGTVTAARHGRPWRKWFASGGTLKDTGHYRAVTSFLLAEAKLAGYRVAFPRHLPQNDFTPAAESIARLRAAGRSVVVQGGVTSSVRTAAAALNRGLDIGGTIFLVGGEALTEAKQKTITDAGAQASPSYYISEVGIVGRACRQITEGNCVHINKDFVAVISRRRMAPLTDVVVDSLLFTPLPRFSPFALINVEMDDAGVIGERKCDCTFGRLGMTGQISDIFSYGKLTGQGTTLIGTDILLIIEEALPRRFGGAPGDYQLVEKETQLTLRVSPRTGAQSVDEIRTFFLGEIKKLFGGARTRRDWVQTEGVKVILEEPMATATGKVLPLDLLGFGKRGNVA